MFTNLLLTVLTCYWFACYLFAVSTLLRKATANGDSQRAFAWYLYTQDRPVYSRVIVAVISVFLSPILLPIGLAIGCWELRKEWARERKSLRTHSDYQFVWTPEKDLPEEALEYFQQHTPELKELGFYEYGDYLMKHEPPDYYGRLLTEDSGTIVASLCYMNGSTFFSFSTTLESGRVLDASPAEPVGVLEKFQTNPRITAVLAPGDSIESVYARHREHILSVYHETGDRPLAIDEGMVCAAIQYEGRVFGEELFSYGKRDAPPPEPVMPAGTPVDPLAVSTSA